MAGDRGFFPLGAELFNIRDSAYKNQGFPDSLIVDKIA
jgi:hypothetical protein